MDTRQFETLLAIVKHGGFAAAARAVHLTASAVSQQVAGLEEEIGAPIFDRSRRPPKLTAKGAEVVRTARAVLQLVHDARTPAGGAVRGTLAIGSLRTGAQSILPRALAALRPIYPDLTYRLRIGMSEELMNEVASGQLDAALVAEHVAVPPSLYWTEVVSEMLVVITPPGTHSRSLEEVVSNIPYIRYRTQVPLARQVDTEIARLGVEPEQIVSVNTMTSVIGCVQAGLGFAVVPHAVMHNAVTASLGWFPFGHPPIHRRLGIVQSPHSTRGGVLSRLSETLREVGRPDDDCD
ncbi:MULTISPECIES: LysR family transcriptional regulator [Roseovarius]|jgi:DNA-binding transcriptional LysR family regulator|uniref:LysR family transcriptional regulator n=1 Tax=Roseovarius TaxID=74030 RepID=UPI000CDE1CBA|nr:MULTISPECIES: LysR family transcriptional regulator [Roseovarius]